MDPSQVTYEIRGNRFTGSPNGNRIGGGFPGRFGVSCFAPKMRVPHPRTTSGDMVFYFPCLWGTGHPTLSGMPPRVGPKLSRPPKPNRPSGCFRANPPTGVLRVDEPTWPQWSGSLDGVLGATGRCLAEDTAVLESRYFPLQRCISRHTFYAVGGQSFWRWVGLFFLPAKPGFAGTSLHGVHEPRT